MWKIAFKELALPWIPTLEASFNLVEKYEGMLLFHSGACPGDNLLGLNPVVKITEKGIRYGRQQLAATDPLEAIDRIVAENRIAEPAENGFCPALLGYMAYEYKNVLEEPGLYRPRTQGIFPDLYFALFQWYIRFNPATQTARLLALDFPFAFDAIALDNVQAAAHAKVSAPQPRRSYYGGTSLDKEQYQQGVNRIVEYIKNGDIYQVNLTRAIRGHTEYSGPEIAARLAASDSIDYGVFACVEGNYIVSTSPERFFAVTAGRIVTSPIKGTIRKSAENRQLLLASVKNRAELAMIVDLLRNDISRFCIPGTVSVSHFPLVKELINVYHLVADIEGELDVKAGTGFSRIMRAVFPGGSITGCPKIRACQIIDELEPESRGIYTGTCGYLDFRGNMDFNIMIRSLFLAGGAFIFNTGGGITLLSEPEDEYRETIYKTAHIYNAINLEEIWAERYCLTENS